LNTWLKTTIPTAAVNTQSTLPLMQSLRSWRVVWFMVKLIMSPVMTHPQGQARY
jgi:hypothetical protein